MQAPRVPPKMKREKLKKGTPYVSPRCQPSLSTPDRCTILHAMGMCDCLSGRRKHMKSRKHP